MKLPRGNLQGHHPADGPVPEEQIDHMKLIEEGDLLLDALLVQGLQDHVAGPVGRVAGTPHRPLAEFPGMPAERALGDLAVRSPAEREPHVLQLVDGVYRLPAHDLHRVLVGQVIGALDRVEHVPFPLVLFQVAQGRADPPLGGPGVGTGRIQLGENGDLGTASPSGGLSPTGLQGRHQAGAARPHDDAVEGVDHQEPFVRKRGQAPLGQKGPGPLRVERQ